MNLNHMKIPAQFENIEMQDYGTKNDIVEVFFRNIKQKLCKKIEKAQIVVGCVAWLTDLDILESLSKTNTAIVVQKEDFLRPDSINASKFDVRNAYEKISMSYYRTAFNDTVLPEMSYCSDQSMSGIRCVGNHNSDKFVVNPRMHNKFVVFCKYDKKQKTIIAHEVWTGSFNFTNNAGSSFENAVLIKDKKIATAYLREFAQIMAISEPLDWQSKWIAPEWRLGS